MTQIMIKTATFISATLPWKLQNESKHSSVFLTSENGWHGGKGKHFRRHSRDYFYFAKGKVLKLSYYVYSTQ